MFQNSLCHVTVGIHSADKHRLVLTHSRVGEEQRGVVQRDGGGRVPVLVTLLLDEEVHEGLADGGRILGDGGRRHFAAGNVK